MGFPTRIEWKIGDWFQDYDTIFPTNSSVQCIVIAGTGYTRELSIAMA